MYVCCICNVCCEQSLHVYIRKCTHIVYVMYNNGVRNSSHVTHTCTPPSSAVQRALPTVSRHYERSQHGWKFKTVPKGARLNTDMYTDTPRHHGLNIEISRICTNGARLGAHRFTHTHPHIKSDKSSLKQSGIVRSID